MTAHVLCNEAASDSCVPKFRLQASAWIDSSNFGPSSIGALPPAGIRLRWNCPFLFTPVAERIGQPISYSIERAGPLRGSGMSSFSPRVGHASRSPTPEKMWRILNRDGLTFRAPGGDCDGVDAVAFRVPPGATSGTVTLIDVDGTTQFVAELRPGDDFHLEWVGLKQVTFSTNLGVTKVIGFDPEAIGGAGELNFRRIAEIDARVWERIDLKDASERVANSKGEPFLSTGAQGWSDLRSLGDTIADAFARGDSIPADAAAGLSLVAATRFEVAALIGLGFVDGEHAPAVILDNLSGPFLLGADDTIYAYRVSASLRTPAGGTTEVHSGCAFTRTVSAQPLTPASCTVIPTPTAKADLSNRVRPGPLPTKSDTVFRVSCTGQWELTCDLPVVACVATRPFAESSVITGTPFAEAGTFLSGVSALPRLIRHNTLIERREHRYDIPFFDSDVACETETLDLWDRVCVGQPARFVQPNIDYDGIPPLLQSVVCHAPTNSTTGFANLTLDTTLPWVADLLAAYAKARIVLLMRNLDQPQQEADAEIGPASPTPDGQWSAEIRTNLAQSEFDRFVGGVLAVGSLTARVLAVGPISGGLTRIAFEMQTSCAGTDLYPCPNGWLAARLFENPNSSRLWVTLPDTIAVLPTGAPVRTSISTPLPELKASTTLYFATRLEFDFEGNHYQSPICAPLPAPYLHPAPASPTACFNVDQLASDYYNRVWLRVNASQCQPLDPRDTLRLSVAAGEIVDANTFQSSRSEGMFGAQHVFDAAVFEAFSRLATVVEGDPFTVGIANVRTADNRESVPVLWKGTLRRVE